MKFEEALIHLREGKQIREYFWPEGKYISLDFDRQEIESVSHIKWQISDSWVFDDNWVLYEKKQDKEIESQDIQNIFIRLNKIESHIKESYYCSESFNDLRNHVYERLNVVEKLARDHALGLQNVYNEFIKSTKLMDSLKELIETPHKNDLLRLYQQMKIIDKEIQDNEYI